MKIRHKMILGFTGVSALVGTILVACIHISQKILQESMGESSANIAVETMDVIERLSNLALGIAIVLITLGIILGIIIFNHIWRPLSKLRAALSQIADGDLDVRIDVNRNDEIGELAETFNHMAEQRQQTEKVLDESQAKFNAMLRAISDDIALIDNDLNILWTNASAKKIYGDDIVGKKCYEVYHHRNMPCEPYPCSTIKAFYDNQVHQYETMVKDKDGRIRFLHCLSNVALRDEEGRPEAVLEICRDITERRQTEDALRASERKCSDLVQYSPDAIISLDKTGNFLFFNTAAERMTGLSAEGVLGKHFTKIGFLTEDSIQKTLKEFGLLLTGSERSPFELVIIHKDKNPLVTEANARLIEQNDSEIWVQLILRDITERKEAERALDRSENLLRTIINATQDAMIAVNEEGLISLFNPAAEKMFGRARSEVLGKSINLLIPEQYRPKHQQYVKTYFETNKSSNAIGHTIEVPVQHRDGRVFPIELSLSSGIVNDKQMVIAVARDITERKKAEQTLEELNTALETTNLELIRTNKELQEFAYITAHDLKTPLRAIGTLADWLSVDYGEKFDEQGKEHVNLLVTKAKQMSLMIDDILRYSGAGQNTQKSQEVDLKQVLSEVIDEIDPPENIDVIFENPLPKLVGKKTHIIQIFQNLLGNAIKYMDKPKGQIKVRCVEENNCWKFSVADNGPGIEKKYYDKIFKIFQTLSPREGVESTGIGLSIVKKLVELNKGTVWIESEVGKGSTFYFTVPKNQKASLT
jgi:two-component system sensor kinase FixL